MDTENEVVFRFWLEEDIVSFRIAINQMSKKEIVYFLREVWDNSPDDEFFDKLLWYVNGVLRQ